MTLSLIKRAVIGHPITIPEHDQNLTDIEVAVNALQTAVGVVDIAGMEADVTALQVSDSAQQTLLDAQGIAVAANSADIAATEGQVVLLQTNMVTALAGVSGLTARADVSEGEIDTLQTEMIAAQGAIGTQGTAITGAEADIDALQTGLTATQGDVTALDTRVDATEVHVAIIAGNPHGMVKADLGLGNVTDDAQLKRADGDFASFTSKAAPVGADIVLVEDSAAAGAKKKVALSALPVPTHTHTLDALPAAFPTIGAGDADKLVSIKTDLSGFQYVAPGAGEGGAAVAQNALINANFETSLRSGTTSSWAVTSTKLYTLDRWCAGRSTAATGLTVTKTAITDLPGSRFAMRLQRPNGTATVHFNSLAQGVETANCLALFANGYVTVSFWAKAGANYSAADMVLKVRLNRYSAVDAPLVQFTATNNTIQDVTLTTEWQKFTLVFTTGAYTSYKTLSIVFYHAPVGTAGVNDWFEIAQPQMEPGQSASAFQQVSAADDAARCLRYYEAGSLYCSSVGSSATVLPAAVTYCAPKRTASVTVSGVYDITAATGFSVVSVQLPVATGFQGVNLTAAPAAAHWLSANWVADSEL